MPVSVPVPFPAGFFHFLPLMLQALPVIPPLALAIRLPIIRAAKVVIVEVALRIRISSAPLRIVTAVSVPIGRTLQGESQYKRAEGTSHGSEYLVRRFLHQCLSFRNAGFARSSILINRRPSRR
jgi:hypothetical protein